MEREIISIREYARRKGCSDMNVRQAIKAGKIVKGVVPNEKGIPKIDPAIADQEWRDNFAPERVQNPALAASLGVGIDDPEPDDTEPKEGQTAPPLPDDIESMTLNQAQRLEQIYKAKQRKIEYEKAVGKLVEAEAVYKNLFAFGQEVRTALMAIPDRVIDLLLSAKDRHAAHKLLYDEIANALEVLSEAETRDFTR